MAIVSDVKALAYYIQEKYTELYQGTISPLKLQKSLYFLFAYWGGFITRAKNAQKANQSIEVDYSAYDTYLFDEPIEAWVYGPVVPVVYANKDNLQEYRQENLFNDKFVKEFVDDLLSQIFRVSDFRLVDISHSDNVWKKYFNEQDTTHNAEMPKEEIISEYVSKIEQK